MDFSWALRKLKEGRAVRRSDWDRYSHFHDEYSHVELVRDLPGFEPTLVVTLNSGARASYRLNDPQVLAEDWELKR
jgi:hypothetical protein